MKQSELAERLGISQNQISRYENSSMNPTLETVVQMADIFNTTTDYLLGRSDKPHPDADPIHPELSPTEAEMVALMREHDPEAQARMIDIMRLILKTP